MTSSGRRNDDTVRRDLPAPQLLQNRKHGRRLGAPRVVGVHLGVSDRTVWGDDVTSGHRQRPTVLAVKLRQVRTERLLHLTQIVRQSPAHAELSGDFPAMVAEDREPQSVLPLRFAAIGRRLL